MGKFMTRTIIPFGSNIHGALVDDHIPIDVLEKDDQVRVGFEKGTLVKATFELTFGATVIYEISEENTPNPKTALRRNMDD